jgi:hypothetical protein
MIREFVQLARKRRNKSEISKFYRYQTVTGTGANNTEVKNKRV